MREAEQVNLRLSPFAQLHTPDEAGQMIHVMNLGLAEIQEDEGWLPGMPREASATVIVWPREVASALGPALCSAAAPILVWRQGRSRGVVAIGECLPETSSVAAVELRGSIPYGALTDQDVVLEVRLVVDGTDCDVPIGAILWRSKSVIECLRGTDPFLQPQETDFEQRGWESSSWLHVDIPADLEAPADAIGVWLNTCASPSPGDLLRQGGGAAAVVRELIANAVADALIRRIVEADQADVETSNSGTVMAAALREVNRVAGNGELAALRKMRDESPDLFETLLRRDRFKQGNLLGAIASLSPEPGSV